MYKASDKPIGISNLGLYPVYKLVLGRVAVDPGPNVLYRHLFAEKYKW